MSRIAGYVVCLLEWMVGSTEEDVLKSGCEKDVFGIGHFGNIYIKQVTISFITELSIY